MATWNMYCFFDGTEDGTEYAEFKSSAGYTRSRYQERIKATVRLIATDFGSPDVMVLEEVESAQVLHDLLDEGLSRLGYRWYGLAQEKPGYLAVGFLSKIEPEEITLHGVEGCRLILCLDFLIHGEPVRILGLHARSRLENDSWKIRREEFSLAASLAEEKKDGLVLLMGDFNCDPSFGDPDMALEREMKGNAPLVITGDGGSAGNDHFYSPMADYDTPLSGGTYFHEGEWSFLDNILCSYGAFDGEGLEYRGSRILKPGEATDYAGRPLKYDCSTGFGFSDHFALEATFGYD